MVEPSVEVQGLEGIYLHTIGSRGIGRALICDIESAPNPLASNVQETLSLLIHVMYALSASYPGLYSKPYIE